MNQKDHEEYQNALNAKMQKPVSKEPRMNNECKGCGKTIKGESFTPYAGTGLYHLGCVPKAPKLTPIDRNTVPPSVLNLADKVNEIINLINGETE